MGVAFSTTTTTTTTTRRRTTHPHPYALTSHPMDYYPPYPLYEYPPFYTSNAYNVCNHPNPIMGHPYFAQFELPAAAPARAPAPGPSGEEKPAKVVNSDVNVHKDSLRLEIDELKPDHYLVSFVFDALLDGSITICYFAKEEPDRRVVPLFPEAYVPIKVPFRKGLNQQFRQPPGTGIQLSFFALENLSNPSSRDSVFPIVISADTCAPSYMVDDRSYLLPHTFPQVQITQVAVVKNHEAQFSPKVIRQLLWTDDVCYELREIYGLGKSGSGCNDNGSGKECVICMTEPKDVAVLPCRHMCMCSTCAKALRVQSNKCPICREIIESLLEIKIDNIDHFQ